MAKTAEALMFFKAAHQRFEDALILLREGRTTGATYMAGYAVECGLKAVLRWKGASDNGIDKAKRQVRGSHPQSFA